MTFDEWASKQPLKEGTQEYAWAHTAWCAAASQFINDWDDGYTQGRLMGVKRSVDTLVGLHIDLEKEAAG